MNKSRLLGAACACALTTLSAHSVASIVEFSFIAEVTNSSNNPLFLCPDEPLIPCRTGPAGMIAGDKFQGTIKYDRATTGLPFSGSTEYQLFGPPNSVYFDIGDGMQFDQVIAQVRDNTTEIWVDQFSLEAGTLSNLPAFKFEFGTADGNLLNSEALIVDADVYNSFEFRRGKIWLINPSNSQVAESLQFNMLNITAIPLPPTLWLFGSGLLGLVGFSRRKKAA